MSTQPDGHPLADQRAAALRDTLATADALREARIPPGMPSTGKIVDRRDQIPPPWLRRAITAWAPWSGPHPRRTRLGCRHANTPQPMAGRLTRPGRLYCRPCVATRPGRCDRCNRRLDPTDPAVTQLWLHVGLWPASTWLCPPCVTDLLDWSPTP